MVDLRDRVTYVYIDLPNLILGKKERRNLDLRVLLQNIELFGAAGTDVRSVTLYASKDMKSDLVHLAPDSAIRDMPVVVSLPERHKDVDLYMVNDIWHALVQEHSRRKLRIRHVIVSGDADFVRMYRSIRSTPLWQSLDLEVAVYSWRDRCSFLWHSISNRIHYLDDIPHIAGKEASEAPLT